MGDLEEVFDRQEKILTTEDKDRLERQNSRLVSDHIAKMLELEAKKYWDLFYKRNETRFFKDRHWTTREFHELLNSHSRQERVLFEIGCGVGNFFYPLIEERLNFKIVACDLSPRAIDMVKSNVLYDVSKVTAFQCDVTSDSDVFQHVKEDSIDIVTLIFVLSAIHPDKFGQTLRNIYKLLKPNGLLLFRDYGLYDMAQLRFKPGHKISDNFYMRQDGTRSYYFSTENVKKLFEEAGFNILDNSYVHRRTVNLKENVDVPRIFVQVKASKPVKL